MIGQFVLVRTRNAGVHFGTLKSREGQDALLADARRLWYWTGARTLNEISQAGVSKQSKITQPVPLIQLTDVIEIIPCSEAAQTNLSESRWG